MAEKGKHGIVKLSCITVMTELKNIAFLGLEAFLTSSLCTIVSQKRSVKKILAPTKLHSGHVKHASKSAEKVIHVLPNDNIYAVSKYDIFHTPW